MEHMKEGARVLLANSKKLSEQLERYELNNLDKINPIDLKNMLNLGKITLEELNDIADWFIKNSEQARQMADIYENSGFVINEFVLDIRTQQLKKDSKKWFK